jgi:putative thiamine transport system substrate-binding protein
VPDRGTLANVSFVAIPFNASYKAAAMVTANFLLSPEAQLRAQNPQYPVGMPVIDLTTLSAAEQAQFAASRQTHPSAPPLMSGRQQLQEPHPSWVEALEQAWIARYGNR